MYTASVKRFIALSISQIFNPILAWPFFIVLLLLGTGLSGQQQQFLVTSLGLLELILPIALLGLFIRLHWISDVDITQVKERRLFFVLILLLHVLSAYFVWSVVTWQAWELLLAAFVVEVVGTLVTFGWKISGHLAASSFLFAVIIHLFGWQWWPLLLLLPLIAWSRVVLKKHTVMQTIAGSVLSLFAVWLVDKLIFVV